LEFWKSLKYLEEFYCLTHGESEELIGRCDRIRTYDPFTPSEVRYQAALHTDRRGAVYGVFPALQWKICLFGSFAYLLGKLRLFCVCLHSFYFNKRKSLGAVLSTPTWFLFSNGFIITADKTGGGPLLVFVLGINSGVIGFFGKTG
jgi:hypothetical protein